MVLTILLASFVLLRIGSVKGVCDSATDAGFASSGSGSCKWCECVGQELKCFDDFTSYEYNIKSFCHLTCGMNDWSYTNGCDCPTCGTEEPQTTYDSSCDYGTDDYSFDTNKCELCYCGSNGKLKCGSLQSAFYSNSDDAYNSAIEYCNLDSTGCADNSISSSYYLDWNSNCDCPTCETNGHSGSTETPETTEEPCTLGEITEYDYANCKTCYCGCEQYKYDSNSNTYECMKTKEICGSMYDAAATSDGYDAVEEYCSLDQCDKSNWVWPSGCTCPTCSASEPHSTDESNESNETDGPKTTSSSSNPHETKDGTREPRNTDNPKTTRDNGHGGEDIIDNLETTDVDDSIYDDDHDYDDNYDNQYSYLVAEVTLTVEYMFSNSVSPYWACMRHGISGIAGTNNINYNTDNLSVYVSYFYWKENDGTETTETPIRRRLLEDSTVEPDNGGTVGFGYTIEGTLKVYDSSDNIMDLYDYFLELADEFNTKYEEYAQETALTYDGRGFGTVTVHSAELTVYDIDGNVVVSTSTEDDPTTNNGLSLMSMSNMVVLVLCIISGLFIVIDGM